MHAQHAPPLPLKKKNWWTTKTNKRKTQTKSAASAASVSFPQLDQGEFGRYPPGTTGKWKREDGSNENWLFDVVVVLVVVWQVLHRFNCTQRPGGTLGGGGAGREHGEGHLIAPRDFFHVAFALSTVAFSFPVARRSTTQWQNRLSKKTKMKKIPYKTNKRRK